MDVVGDMIKLKVRRVLFCFCGVNIMCFIRFFVVFNKFVSLFDERMFWDELVFFVDKNLRGLCEMEFGKNNVDYIMGLENEIKLERNLDMLLWILGVFFVVVLILIVVVNIVFNVLVLVVLVRNNCFCMCINFFIVNLSLVDLLVGIIFVFVVVSLFLV